MAVACIGSERWLALWRCLPPVLRDHFTAEGDGHAAFAAFEGTVFFWGLIALVAPVARPLWQGVRAMIAREDLRAGLFGYLVIQLLSLVTRPSSLGIDYQGLSLSPFGQATWGLHRRLLSVALSSFVHLDGGLFIVFHMITTLLLLTLVYGFLRRHGRAGGLLGYASLLTASFAFHNVQYPGYPDPLVLIIALALAGVRLPVRGIQVLTILALLTHEALAVVVLGPILLWLPRRQWLAVALPFLLYGLLWAADYAGDVGAGWHAQVDYAGHSGPQLLLSRPLTEVLGMLVANKLLWLLVAGHGIAVWRRSGAADAVRVLAPAAAALLVCVPSYDTSRMAGVGFMTLLLAFAGQADRLKTVAGQGVLIVNLLLPSVYVSPIVEQPLGVVWMPGLYSAYHGFVASPH